jgi:alpha-L-rhamnosidase
MGFQIQAASSLQLLRAEPDLWDSGTVDSSENRFIRYAGMAPQPAQSVYWRMRCQGADGWGEWSSAARWKMGLGSNWRWWSRWMYAPSAGDWTQPQPVTAFRKAFQLDRPISQAWLHISARGLIQTHVNGSRTSSTCFIPGWTDYHKRIAYEAHDVTDLLRAGENVLSCLLADGWYSGQLCWFGRNHYGQQPAALLRLAIAFESGEPVVIASGDGWRCSPSGIVQADIIQGEHWNATAFKEDWRSQDFDDSHWSPSLSSPIGPVPLVPRKGPPVRVVETLEPKSIEALPSGKLIVDFGQNHAGALALQASRPIEELSIRHGELLTEAGELYTENLRGAAQLDRATGMDAGDTFAPQFTFHGFRYAELEGIAPSDIQSLTSRVVCSDLERTGWFECSDPRINRLVDNAVWSLKSNFIDVPTDCPQRDERLGWMGDAQVFAPTAAYLFDVGAFLSKWMDDVCDGASAEGIFPNVAPQVAELVDGAPGWADAGIAVPHALLQFYGDVPTARDCLPAIVRHLQAILDANPRGLWTERRSHDFGDWLSMGEETDKRFLATAYLYRSLCQAEAMSEACDWPLPQSLRGASSRVKNALVETFFEREDLREETQTGYCLSLAFGFAPNPKRAGERLANLIRQNRGKLSTGFLGVSHLLPALSASGHADLAFDLLFQTEFPSWLYPVERGATTIWERWDGQTDAGLQDPGMNSFNHYAYGSVVEWLFSGVGGIRPIEHGFHSIELRPHIDFGKRMNWAKTSFESPHGRIVSNWNWTDTQLIWEFEIPVQVNASIVPPQLEEGWNWATEPPRECQGGSYAFTAKPS